MLLFAVECMYCFQHQDKGLHVLNPVGIVRSNFSVPHVIHNLKDKLKILDLLNIY